MTYPILYAIITKSYNDTAEITYVDRISFEQCVNLIRLGVIVSKRDEKGIWVQLTNELLKAAELEEDQNETK